MSHLFYDFLRVFFALLVSFSLVFVCRTTSLWMSSIISRATWRQGCRITRLEAPHSLAKMAWQAHAAPAEARSTTPLYRMPVPQHTCSLWRTHTNKGCRSSAPSTSSPSAPGELRISKEHCKIISAVFQLVCYMLNHLEPVCSVAFVVTSQWRKNK